MEPVGMESSSPVAIVDDHGDTAESVAQFLEAAGFPAVAFTDSEDFLAAFESVRPWPPRVADALRGVTKI